MQLASALTVWARKAPGWPHAHIWGGRRYAGSAEAARAVEVAGEALRRSADRYIARAPDLLAGPFAHIVVDEAQELTDAEWQMLLIRCPSGA